MKGKRIQRNGYRYFEWGETAMLVAPERPDKPLVEINELCGDSRDSGEMMYDVTELKTRQRYRVMDSNLMRLTAAERNKAFAEQFPPWPKNPTNT